MVTALATRLGLNNIKILCGTFPEQTGYRVAYGFLSTGGITRLVNEERSKTDRLMLHNLNGHAVFVKM